MEVSVKIWGASGAVMGLLVLALPVTSRADCGADCSSSCEGTTPASAWAKCMEPCLKGCRQNDPPVVPTPSPPTPVKPEKAPKKA